METFLNLNLLGRGRWETTPFFCVMKHTDGACGYCIMNDRIHNLFYSIILRYGAFPIYHGDK